MLIIIFNIEAITMFFLRKQGRKLDFYKFSILKLLLINAYMRFGH